MPPDIDRYRRDFSHKEGSRRWIGGSSDGKQPSIAQLFTHIHFVRLVFVSEDAAEFATNWPEEEWVIARDPDRIALMLNDSTRAVRDAVKHGGAGREMDLHYDHPICFSSTWSGTRAHHHGQIKLALKAAGRPISDEQVGPLTWDVWMRKKWVDPLIEPCPYLLDFAVEFRASAITSESPVARELS